MRLLAAIILLFAFLTNGAVAQYRAESKTAAIVSASVSGFVSASFAGESAIGKVCKRVLLTGMPEDDAGLPGPGCFTEFKLYREAEAMRFPDSLPHVYWPDEPKLDPDNPGSPFRPPIA